MQVVKSTKNSRLLEVLIDEKRKEMFSFDGIKPREHFCQLIQQMKTMHSSQTDLDTISVFCGTWNMGMYRDRPSKSLCLLH